MTAVDRIEIVTNFAAAISAGAYAAWLWRRERRQELDTRLASLLGILAVALFARAFYDLDGHHVADHLKVFCFAVFPIAAAFYVESALRWSFSRSMKLFVLTGVVFFAATSATEWIHGPRWIYALLAFHVFFVTYAFQRFLRGARLSTGPRRSYYATMALLSLVALAAAATDYRTPLGLPVIRLGAVSVLLLIYVSSKALHFRGRWTSRETLMGFAGACVACALIGVAGVWVLEASLQSSWLVASTALTGYLAASPWLVAWQAESRTRLAPMTARVVSLPTESLEGCLTALERWPELREVAFQSWEQLEARGYDRLRRIFELDQDVIDRVSAERSVLEANDDAGRSEREQLVDLLGRDGLDFVAPVPGGLVGIAIEGPLDVEGHRSALLPTASVLRLLGRQS